MAHIFIKNISVEFKIYGQNSRSLRKKFLNQVTGGVIDHNKDAITVKAIDSFSLELKEGDKVGLTGHNGAGKSTLLRVIAGIYKPTLGSVTIRGSVGTLIDMTAGMDSEATGVENIYLRGYILGMSKKKIQNLIDEVCDFTGLGNFINLPIKTYSAGMSSRLSLALSTPLISPDILVVDEGIGAGDEEFQERALTRINEFKSKVKILIMANHDENSLRPYCNKIIQIKSGKIIEQ